MSNSSIAAGNKFAGGRVRKQFIRLKLILLICNLIIRSLNNIYFKPFSLNFSSNDANHVSFLYTIDLNDLHPGMVHYHVLSNIFNRVKFIYKNTWSRRCTNRTILKVTNNFCSSLLYSNYIFNELSIRMSLPSALKIKTNYSYYYHNLSDQQRTLLYNHPSIPHNGLFYTTSSNTGSIKIVADRVSLPSIEDQISSIELSSVLPPSIYERYYNVRSILVSKPINLNKFKRPTAHCESRAEYIKLIGRLVRLKMVTFTDAPIVVNGLFGVPKDGDKIRLIIDATPANLMLVPPPHVQLPNPSHLANLSTNGSFFVSKLDLENYYHQLRLPVPLQPLFCLPSLTHDELQSILPSYDSSIGIHYPMLQTLPMGFSHAVYIAQAAHEHILYSITIALSPANNILITSVLICTLHMIYIDDLCIIGYDYQMVQSMLVQVQVAYKSVGIKINVKKSIQPTMSDVKVIGVQLNGYHQRMFIDGTDIVTLIHRTMILLDAGQCTGHEMSVLVGHWCWYLLVNRPLLSALNQVYKFIQVFKATIEVKTIWSCVHRELLTVCGVSAMLQIDLSTVVSTRVLATDASMFGYGIVANRSTVYNSEVQNCLNRLSAHVGLNSFECASASYDSTGSISSVIDSITVPFSTDQPVVVLTNHYRTKYKQEIVQLVRTLMEHVDFITIMSGVWKYNEYNTHINELELQSVLLGVRWLCSLVCVRGSGRRIVLLVDNAVSKYVVTKGRSSSIPLMKLLRRLCCFTIAMDIRLQLIYIPSEWNPADGPSRIGSSNSN